MADYPVSFFEKEQKLQLRIEKNKAALMKLQEKRKHTIGALAVKHGLDRLDNATLEDIFRKINQERMTNG